MQDHQAWQSACQRYLDDPLTLLLCQYCIKRAVVKHNASADMFSQELAEETSISSIEHLAEVPRWLHYEFPPEVRQRLHGSWSKYKGQAQRWFLFKFTGDDSGSTTSTHGLFISDQIYRAVRGGALRTVCTAQRCKTQIECWRLQTYVLMNHRHHESSSLHCVSA